MKYMNRLMTLLCACVVLIMSSCSKDNDTVARELLSTVPSNAAAVVLIDGEQMVDKAGGGDNVMALLNKKADNDAKPMLTTLSKVWSPTSAVVFMDGEYTYLTTQVDDPSTLISDVEKQSRSKLSTDGDMSYNGQFAVLGNQVWVSIGKGSLNPASIKGYAKYSERQSFAGSDYCDELISKEQDVAGIFNISSFMSLGGRGFKEAAMGQMAVAALFDNASYVDLTVDFKNGEVVADAAVLNSKYKRSKFLLPVSTVDIETVKKTSPAADVLMAVNIDSKLVAKIKDIAKSLGGSLPEEWMQMMQPIDGTIATAGEADSANMSGIITTNGDSSMALSQLLAEYHLTTATEGKMLTFRQGPEVKGKLDVAKCAEYFKGAWGGVVGVNSDQALPGITQGYAMIIPHGGGLTLRAKAICADPKTNALTQLLK